MAVKGSKKRPTSKGDDKAKGKSKKAKTEPEAEEGQQKLDKHSKDGVWIQNRGAEDLSETVKELNKRTASALRDDEDEERGSEVKEIYASLKGRMLKFAMKHDACRSVQVCFRFGNEEMRESILEELKGKMVSLSKDKYSCFLVIALLRYGSDAQRVKVLNELRGHMSRLATHNCGSRVLDFAFTHCNVDAAKTKRGRAAKRAKKSAKSSDEGAGDAGPVLVSVPAVLSKLRLEFCGPEFAIFGQENADAAPTEAKMYANLNMKRRRAALASMHRIVTKQAEKGILRLGFAHSIARALVERCELNIAELKIGDDDGSAAKAKTKTAKKGGDDEGDADKAEAEAGSAEETAILTELVPLVAEASLAMISTADGAYAVARCIAHASAKERKKYVRVFKGHAANLCFHEFGFLALASLINVLDDTVLLKKSILPEILEENVLERLVASVQVPDATTSARLVYMQTLTSKVNRYFRRVDFEAIQPAPGTSKKDPEARVSELRDATAFPLAKALEGSVEASLPHPHGAELLVEVMAASWASSLMDELLEVVKAAPEIVEKPLEQRTLKRLIVAEGAREGNDRAGFAQRLWDLLQPRVDSLIGVNAACFLLVALVEHPDTADAVKAELKSNKACASALKATSGKDATPGLKVLAKLVQ
ncbi:Pumilio-likey domain family member 6 [Hondaea fermentalgiana]|uniref:Pumilio-likey domain family member 6 n=1 Tax=Hondaea fermentalgiana TaxID=2315210 RepID=A0A2R5G506_9STRA|nr:Pumilio-likey domain family member 6 [Hondaea fermentalgiana]|eukprot:GBG26060.1 Pumilio-likey domain family member 6 [Hondaea fermentalgiana]